MLLGTPPPMLAPWPMERQDRYGTARSLTGPRSADYCTPWVDTILGGNKIVSHGASIGDNGIGYFGTWVSNKLYQVDLATKTITGTFSAENFIASTPAIGSKYIFVSTDNPSARMYAVNPANMLQVWSTLTGYIGSSPTLGLEGDVAVAGTVGNIRRLRSNNGKQVWSTAMAGNPRGSVVFSRDDLTVYASHGNHMTAYNWATGAQVWDYDAGSPVGAPGVSPSGKIIFGNDLGRIHALRPDGTLAWHLNTTGEVRAAPAFMSDGTVVVGSFDQYLYALRSDTGHFRWKYQLSNSATSGAVVGADNRVYIHDRSGRVSAVSKTGVQLWTMQIGAENRGPLTIGPDGTLYVGFTNDSNQTYGMAVIRQTPFIGQVTPGAVSSGVTSTGDASALLAADVMLFSADAVSPAPKTISAEFSAKSNKTNLANISLELVSRSSGDTATQVVSIYDYTTNSWLPISTRGVNPTTWLTAKLAVPGDASRFVSSSDKSIKIRLDWTRKTKNMVSAWSGLVYQLTIKIVPSSGSF